MPTWTRKSRGSGSDGTGITQRPRSKGPVARRRTPEVQLVDFAASWPEKDELVDVQAVASFLTAGVEEDVAAFIADVLAKAVMSPLQWFPKSFQNIALLMQPEYKDFCLDYEDAQEEYRTNAVRAITDLFQRSGVEASQVDVVVCSSTMMTKGHEAVMQGFDFRDDVEVMMHGGMGCAAGGMAMDFANKLLSQRTEPTTMLFFTCESLIRGFYTANDPGSMVSNVLFRMGGVAVLCSTDPAVARTAKFRMDFTTRTYQTDDLSVKSMGYKLDGKGYGGMFLPKKEDLGAISARAISHTMARIGREALPFSEKVKYVLHGGKYKPDFSKVFDHICVHPGGPAVIEKVGNALGYDAAVVSANSINAYHHYGNTSSSGIFYSLAHTETFEGIKAGEKIMLIGLGAGFEANGMVLTALRDCTDVHRAYQHMIDDPSLQLAAVDAFVRGFRNRERVIAELDLSDEQMVRSMTQYARDLGFAPYPDPDEEEREDDSSTPRRHGRKNTVIFNDDDDDDESSSSSAGLATRTPEPSAKGIAIRD